MAERPLTEMQRRFAELYRGDAQRAAVLAGYAEGPGAKVTGCRLLKDPRIRALINARRGKPKDESPTPAKPRPSKAKPKKTKPKRAKAEPAEPAEPANDDPEAILRAIANDPAAHPGARLKAAETLARWERERRTLEPPARDPFEIDRPTTPAVWVWNERVPAPPDLVLELTLRLEPRYRRWVAQGALRSLEGDATPARPPWGERGAELGEQLVRLERAVEAIAHPDARRYFLEKVLGDPEAPAPTRARAAELLLERTG